MTETTVIWPTRRVVYTTTHASVGDGFFTPMIHQAFAELAKADPDGCLESFTASNGVTIGIDWSMNRLPDEEDEA